MNGILNINKSAGVTSFRVVAAVKRIVKERHAGHAGTLDPLATGVLPVCLGQATRVIQYLHDETKIYRALVELGISTDTYDSSGQVTEVRDSSNIRREMVESILTQFKGTILQTPPMYSAIRHHGQKLYQLARSGIEVERVPRPTRIFNLALLDWQPPLLTLEVECGKGTYIRSLVHDLGEALGSGANMKSLERLKVGPFRIEDALTLEQLEEKFQCGQGQDLLYPIDSVLTAFNALVVNHEQQCTLIHGGQITFPGLTGVSPGSLSRIYTADGRFLGMARFDKENNNWQPEKIFFRHCPAEESGFASE